MPQFDETGNLRALSRYTPPLTPPDRLDAEVIARSFAGAQGDLLGIIEAWIQNLELVARDRTKRHTLLRFCQQWAGVPVYQSDLRLHISPSGEIVEMNFQLESLPVPTSSPADESLIAPASALLRCVEGLEPELRNPRIEMRERAQGPRRRTRLRFGPAADEVIAQWVWFPVGDHLYIAWQFDAVSTGSGIYYECVVDGADGTLLYRQSITDSEITALVHGSSSPQPGAIPGKLPPIPNPPDIVPRSLVSLSGDPTASPEGWVGSTKETIGNNVTAREHWLGDNETTLGTTAQAINDSFNFELQLGSNVPSPLNFIEASLTGLFYWCNVAHDYFYQLGFTEAAGNFQENNFSRGGLDQDSDRADAQDGIKRPLPNLSNANMSTPSDGSRPRLSMFLFGNSGGPHVDMRDSLIAADQADHGGEDIDLIWEAFARRGIGSMAAGGTGSSLIVLPSQDLPSPLGKVRFFDDVFYNGETVRVYLGDSSNLAPTLSLPVESTGGDSETVTFMRTGAIYKASVSAARNDGVIQVANGNIISVAYHDADGGAGHARDTSANAEIRAAYATVLESENIAALQETRFDMPGDNPTKAYTLPFGFPFYNRLISTIYVPKMGLITFGTPTALTNSQSNLSRISAIAPLWMDLRISGTAAPNEGIYVANPTPTSIRFRWSAETAKFNSQFVLIPADPVSFAVTLFQNGDIVFSYGQGNVGVTPTVGVSRGNEDTTQIFADYNSSGSAQPRTLTNAQSMHWIYSGNSWPTTVFPYLSRGAMAHTGYAIANGADKPMDVLFTAQADNGASLAPDIDPQSLHLAGGGQLAMVEQEIFPGLPLGFSGWAEVKPTDSRIAAFFLTGDSAPTYASGALASSRLSKNMIFTHLPGGEETSGTSLYLVNPGALQAHATLCWYDAATNLPLCVERMLAPRTGLAAEVRSLFDPLPQGFKSGYLRLDSDRELAGVTMSRGNSSPYFVMPQEPSSATTLYAAQFASGNTGPVACETTINLVNASLVRKTVEVRLVGNNGLPIQYPGIANPRTLVFDPGEQMHFGGDTLFGLPDPAVGTLFEGTLILTADGAGMVGDITFGAALTHRFTASLPLDPGRESDLIFAQVAEGIGDKAYFTGIAAFNPNAADVTLRIQVFTRKGIQTGDAGLTLPAGARMARTLGQLVPGINQTGAYVRVTTAGGPISAFAV